jgi:hypothetical protein
MNLRYPGKIYSKSYYKQANLLACYLLNLLHRDDTRTVQQLNRQAVLLSIPWLDYA